MSADAGNNMVNRGAVLLLLFTATGSSSLARSSFTWEYLSIPTLLLLVALYLGYVNRVVLSYRLLQLIGVYIFLFAIQFAIYESFHPKHLFLYPVNFLIAYLYLNALGDDLFVGIEYIITQLSILATVIWLIDVISSGGLRATLSGIYILEPYAPIIDSYIGVYTFVNEGVDSYLPRNSGFAWEPGAFAIFVCIALLINLYRRDFRIYGNHSALALLLALLSTQSTTGYSILLIIISGKIWRDSRGSWKLLFPLLVMLLMTVGTFVPFMQEKMVELWQQDLNELAHSASQSWNAESPIAAQRFLSLRLDLTDFLNNPWTGYGGRESEMLVNREALNVVSISGLGKILARFGIVGALFFLISVLASSIDLSRRYGADLPWLVATVIVLISVSYSLVEHPLLQCIWAYSFYRVRKSRVDVGAVYHPKKWGSYR